MMGSGKDLNNKYKQLLELKNNAVKSRLSRKSVHYKKSDKVLKMTPKDRALQKEHMQAHRDFIRRRDRTVVIVSILSMTIIVALLFMFVL